MSLLVFLPKTFLFFEDIGSDTLEKLRKELKQLGCDSWKTKIGGDGMTIDKWTVDNGKNKQSLIIDH